MKYKEQTKGNKRKRRHGNNLTPGAFGGKSKFMHPEYDGNTMRIIPKSKRKV